MKPRGPFKTRVLDWYDGDTCHMVMDLVFGIQVSSYDLDGDAQLRCRIYGMNAPELRDPGGAEAKAYAEQLCPNGTIVEMVSMSWDARAKRFDGSITLPDGRDFAQAMIVAGHAVEFIP